MRTIGIGVDVVEVARFAELLRRQPRLESRLFTEGERRDAQGQVERLAARFAAKEATLKAFGVGLGAMKWHEMEVVRASTGAPSLTLHGAARALGEARGVRDVLLSQSHTDKTATAFVVAQGD
jgi:holo-[acyl-carrier protein] synthase